MRPLELFRRKIDAMILARRVEDAGGRWALWLDLQYPEEGHTKLATVCRGKFSDRDAARREMARWPVGSNYRY